MLFSCLYKVSCAFCRLFDALPESLILVSKEVIISVPPGVGDPVNGVGFFKIIPGRSFMYPSLTSFIVY